MGMVPGGRTARKADKANAVTDAQKPTLCREFGWSDEVTYCEPRNTLLMSSREEMWASIEARNEGGAGNRI